MTQVQDPTAKELVAQKLWNTKVGANLKRNNVSGKSVLSRPGTPGTPGTPGAPRYVAYMHVCVLFSPGREHPGHPERWVHLGMLNICMFVFLHVYAYMLCTCWLHIFMFVCMHACIHHVVHVCIWMYDAHSCAETSNGIHYIHTYIHTCMHAHRLFVRRNPKNTHIYIHTYMHTYVRSCV